MMRKLFVSALAGAFVMSLLVGCGPAADNSNAKTAKLEIFSWWTAGGEADGLAAMFDIYKKQNPGVEVINATVAGGAGTNAKAVLQTRMQQGNPPDSFQVHAGHELIDTWVKADKMEALDMIFDATTKAAYPPGVLDVISSGGHVYSVPVNIHRSNVIWYNKKIFDDNKITPPKSLDELFAAAEKLKKMKIVPFALGDNGIWAATQTLENILLADLGPDQYKGLWNGSTAWDGAAVKKALGDFNKYVKNSNTDHASMGWDAAAQLVIDGKAAMTLMGDWAEGYFKSKGLTPGKDFGWMPTPGTGGSFIMLSDSFGLPKGAVDRDNVLKWLALCASKEGQDAFNPKKGSIPSRIDGDANLYDDYLKSAMADFKTNTIVPSVAHGAAASEPWAAEINDTMTTFVSSTDVEKAAKAFAASATKFAKM